MRGLLKWKFDANRVGKMIVSLISQCRVDPEMVSSPSTPLPERRKKFSGAGDCSPDQGD